jgi:putative ATP-dependent endonuclease of OLD family
LSADAAGKLAAYTQFWESPEKGIENILVRELSLAVLKRFLAEAATRPDYPAGAGAYDPAAGDKETRALALSVLIARKGEAYGYAALLIAQCRNADELPATIRSILEEIHEAVAVASDNTAGELPS